MKDTAYPLTHWRPRMGFMAFCFLLLAISGMGWLYLDTPEEITVSLDGHNLSFRTHQTTVEGLLEEVGIEVGEGDIVLPGLHANLEEDDHIIIQRARPVILEVDGKRIEKNTHSRTVGDLLTEVGVSLGPHDQITMEGQKVDPETPLLGNPSSGRRGVGMSDALPTSLGRPSPRKIVVQRSVPIQIFDNGVPATLYTIASTAGQALREGKVTIYLGDRVKPSLNTSVSTGMQIYIQRAKPITILADGRRIVARTQAESIEEALRGEGLALIRKDYTIPPEDSPVTDDLTVQVIRVKEEWVIEDEPIPFETVWRPDQELEIDHRRLDQAGEEGLRRRLVRIVYENGQEKERVTENEWVAEEPTTEIIAYGTKITLRELQTPQGPIRHWRKIRVLATSYTAATCGKSPDHPRYGITYLGWKAQKGVIAVDPQVINLGTKIYVPGYGVGTAADTGGAIRGRHIDLAYDEGKLVPWFKWLDVYLLEPMPSPDKIRWILPSWP